MTDAAVTVGKGRMNLRQEHPRHAGGVGIVLESAFMPTQKRHPAPEARFLAPTPRPMKRPKIHPVPFAAGRDGVGIGLVGRF